MMVWVWVVSEAWECSEVEIMVDGGEIVRKKLHWWVLSLPMEACLVKGRL